MFLMTHYLLPQQADKSKPLLQCIPGALGLKVSQQCGAVLGSKLPVLCMDKNQFRLLIDTIIKILANIY